MESSNFNDNISLSRNTRPFNLNELPSNNQPLTRQYTTTQEELGRVGRRRRTTTTTKRLGPIGGINRNYKKRKTRRRKTSRRHKSNRK